MKKIFTYLLAVSLTALSSFTVQSDIDQVIGAIKAGDAGELSKYFDENVELTLPEKSDNYSKAQAVLILKDFFNNNGVKNFDVRHKGEQSGGQFCIGTLQTKAGNYRATVFMKMKGSKQVVKEIRFQAIE
jgi:hypothetical protein